MASQPFHESRFPLEIALGASGGPERKTDIVELFSGHEQRNARWAASRRRYQAGVGIKKQSDLEQVLHFFEERRGRLHGFRFRDPFDFSSAPEGGTPTALDQILGEGDASETIFALVKLYGGPGNEFSRRITKPVTDSILVAVDGAPVAGFTVSDLGEVTLAAAPASGAEVTAGFLFDVPVRFDSDQLSFDLDAFGAGSIPDIPLLEIRL